MLPSSHHEPIISSIEPLSPLVGLDLLSGSASGIRQTPRLPEPAGPRASATAIELAEAFTTFVTSSAKLEHSYRELQSDVSALRFELAERNAALRASLSENDRVRVALHQIVDSMPCGVLVAKRSGQLTMLNAEAARLLELPANGQLPESLHELDSKSALDFRFTQLNENGMDTEQEFCWKTTACERWFHIQVRHLCADADDAAAGITILILRDVTSYKRAESDRESARTAKVLAQITSMLAHEIRNPLASLELFAELIETDASGRDEWIAHLRAGIRSLSGTVNNVLSFHDSKPLTLKPLHMAEVVTGLVRFAKPLLDQASISLCWPSAACDASVLGNESALRQVLLNLLRNAIRHTPAGGTITLCIEDVGDRDLTLACIDTGSGLREDQMNRIFQPGFSGTDDSPGLGLAVCERIMTQHGGRISATNAPGAGARFLLTLPLLGKELPTA